MKLKKKTVFIGTVILLGLLYALPATRDEMDWCWTESRDQAPDYMRYYTEWPKGIHVIEAKQRYDQRTWSDTKRAMIAEALKKHAASKTDPEAIKEKKTRKERFFWKQVSFENTIISYNDYLQRYPDGEFAAPARQRIDELTRQASSAGTGTNASAQ